MSRHDRGVQVPDRRRRRSASEVIGWIVGGLLVLGLIGAIAVGVIVASAFPPLPDLVRPTGILEGSVRVEPDASSTVAVGVDVSSQAVEAAAAGDGVVHFELDVSGAGQRPVEVEVGVRWSDRAVVVRPVTNLPPGADVRWTHPCATGDTCAGLLVLTFGPGGEQESAVELPWRLVADVRPPRGTDVSDAATITLSLGETAP